MLTVNGYHERKWKHYPALRKALEDKKVPSSYYGIISTADNMFDATVRLMEIAVLAEEYQNEIKATAASTGREEMYRDLRRLETELEDASLFFKKTGYKVRKLYDTL